MSMSRQDYTAIANIMKEVLHNENVIGDLGRYVWVGQVAFKLAEYMGTTNSAFKREKFLEACGL